MSTRTFQVIPKVNEPYQIMDDKRNASLQALGCELAELNMQKPKMALSIQDTGPVQDVSSPPESIHRRDSSDTLDLYDPVAPHTWLSSKPNEVALPQAGAAQQQAPKDTGLDVVDDIMTIIERYGQNERNDENIQWLGRIKWEAKVRKHVEANVAIQLVLPAFPWKSVNKVDKVLGALPDLGEELGLSRLQALCDEIEDIYQPGARVTITSDGLVYNDLLGLADGEVYEYGAALRRMAGTKRYASIDFSRIMNLLGMTDSLYMSKDEYLGTVGEARRRLEDEYLPEDFNTRRAIETDKDINLTYCGYILFLSKDLRHSPVTKGITGRNEYKRAVKRVATNMITRGKAFAALIEHVLPDHVRLSIHRSTGLDKLSFPLVPRPDHFSMTPWHCSIVVTSKGEFRTAHAAELRDECDLIERHGRPYFFQERHEVFDWGPHVELDYFYPRGVVISARRGSQRTFDADDYRKLERLGRGFSPVIVKGFQ